MKSGIQIGWNNNPSLRIMENFREFSGKTDSDYLL
jgi:hypothetical protein